MSIEIQFVEDCPCTGESVDRVRSLTGSRSDIALDMMFDSALTLP